MIIRPNSFEDLYKRTLNAEGKMIQQNEELVALRAAVLGEASKIDANIKSDSGYEKLLNKIYENTLQDTELRFKLSLDEHEKYLSAIDSIRNVVINSIVGQQGAEAILTELYLLRNSIIEMNVRNIRELLAVIFELDEILTYFENEGDYLIINQVRIIRKRFMRGLARMRVEEYTQSENEVFDYKKHETEPDKQYYDIDLEGLLIESYVRSGFMIKDKKGEHILHKAIVKLKFQG